MKVYKLPASVPAPELQYDRDAKDPFAEYDAKCESHKKACEEWLRSIGWDGKDTGRLLYEPYADSHALYMFGDHPKKKSNCILIHLPYGDGWDSPNVEHLPRKEVLRRIQSCENYHRAIDEGIL